MVTQYGHNTLPVVVIVTPLLLHDDATCVILLPCDDHQSRHLSPECYCDSHEILVSNTLALNVTAWFQAQCIIFAINDKNVAWQLKSAGDMNLIYSQTCSSGHLSQAATCLRRPLQSLLHQNIFTTIALYRAATCLIPSWDTTQISTVVLNDGGLSGRVYSTSLYSMWFPESGLPCKGSLSLEGIPQGVIATYQFQVENFPAADPHWLWYWSSQFRQKFRGPTSRTKYWCRPETSHHCDLANATAGTLWPTWHIATNDNSL